MYVMADVFRGKISGRGAAAFGGYAIHGVTAVLALWMAMQALGI